MKLNHSPGLHCSCYENTPENKKANNYNKFVNDMMLNFNRFGCNMKVSVNYLHSHLHRIPKNLGDSSEVQGERFHQDINTVELIYQVRWDSRMIYYNLLWYCPGELTLASLTDQGSCVSNKWKVFHKLILLIWNKLIFM